MLFNTFQFAVFFVVVLTAHFLLPHRYRWILLLAASCYFYMAFIPVYILVLALSILIDYVAGIWIEDAPPARRKALLAVSIVANVGLLAVFKYFNFINDNLVALAEALHWNYGVQSLSIILPIGLSFHTFQAMSYTIEVYRGNQRAERHLGIYALYVMFFPQLVAGPIERPQNMLHQFRQHHEPDPDRWRSGLKTMLWGLFKKVAVADLVAPLVNTVYASPSTYSGPALILATTFFAIQIYCDFSGYSDIAIGVARVLGYDLMDNFKQPYFSRSINEFWHRWHISLSSWFRDYLYIPLGGNRVSKVRHYANLLIVFTVSGLWHGAAWTFVLWGALHGFYLVIGRILEPARKRVAGLLGIARFPGLLAFVQTAWIFALANIAWVFFRASSVKDAYHVLTRAFDWAGFRTADLFALGLPRFELAVAFLMILVVMGVDWMLATRPATITALWNRRAFRWAALTACFYGIVFFGVFYQLNFIYFQF